IVEELWRSGALMTIEPYHHSVATCERCHTIIEPLLSEQWFVRMKDLAAMAVEAVQRGDVRFIPERYAKVFFDWMGNIRDWCVSRQVWWGHRMPVWHCQTCKSFVVRIDRPDHCQGCGGTDLAQDENTLDTWFSSALWTFATMGWPDETDDLKRYHPTTLLITDRQIINLWVARMTYSSLAFLHDVPFRDVYIHATVLDKHGQRMSKTKGNVVNPLTLIETYGTDATRFGLISMAAKGQDIRFSDERILAARNFCNKLWNAARFVLINVESTDGTTVLPSTLTDRWILSRLEWTIQTVTAALDDYEFSEAAKSLYEFTWGEYCDWYIELSKSRLAAGDKVVRRILCYVLETALKLLHPFLPFVSEEIYQRVRSRSLTESDHLIGAAWPTSEGYRDEQAEREMALLQEVVTAVRNIRSEMAIPPLQRTPILIRTTDRNQIDILRQNVGIITDLGRGAEVHIDEQLVRPKRSGGAVIGGIDIWVPLEETIDIEAEQMRLTREAEKLERVLEGLERKLADRSFLERAPTEVVEREREKIEHHRQTFERVMANLAILQE
ncbi:MAG: class I tRNA ligase family protein, partial [Candidatus Latescibacteria bacterium]|nr:class I tRNA ligase family protein [Candidatus Latescibacterota bacterium]